GSGPSGRSPDRRGPIPCARTRRRRGACRSSGPPDDSRAGIMLLPEAPLPLSAKEKRVLNPNPYRHYRRTYSVAEVRAGVGALVVLGLVTWWVVWRGAHPDPALFTSLVPGESTVGSRQSTAGTGAVAAAAPQPAALPAHLAASGWSEG